MRKNQFVEIKVLDVKTLWEKVRVLRGEISELVIDKNMNKLKDLKSISKKKKDLAQTMTVIRQKQLLESLENKIKSTSPEKKDTVVSSKKTVVKKKGSK